MIERIHPKRYVGERCRGETAVFIVDPDKLGSVRQRLDPRYEIVRFTDYEFDWGPRADAGRLLQLGMALLFDVLGQDPNAELNAANWCDVVANEFLAELPQRGFSFSAWSLRRWFAERRERETPVTTPAT